jgi:cob(I)alamin adenosyltransferase
MADDRASRRALVLVFTGNGKGKTTAALGTLLRAWGRGWNVIMLQFIKAETGNFGEHRAARKAGFEIIPLGSGFTWLSKDIEKDKALARECWDQCKQRILGGAYDLVTLDEITYPLNYGWLPVEEVLDTLRARPPYTHVIVTGRDAPAELVEFADLVTEMGEVKHPYKSQGIKAQAGIEF